MLKRLTGLVGAYGIAALVASILGRGGRILAGVAGLAVLVSYLAGGHRWGELETFLDASPWPGVPGSVVVWARIYFGAWDGYLGLALGALAVTHARRFGRRAGGFAARSRGRSPWPG